MYKGHRSKSSRGVGRLSDEASEELSPSFWLQHEAFLRGRSDLYPAPVEVPMRMIELDSLLVHLVKHGAGGNGHRRLH
jgi:hypothetical protein